MFASLSFVGEFHPVAVHFPIALLPTILLLKLYGWRRPQPWVRSATGVLLLTALAFCILAVALGLTNRAANGHHGDAMDAHARLGFTTLGVVLLTNLLHFHGMRIAVWARERGPLLQSGARRVARALRLLLRPLKWVLMILLFPLVVLFWLVRAIYRRTLAARIAGVWQSTFHPQLTAAHTRTRRRIRTLAGRTPASAPAELAFALSLVLVLLTGLKGANLSHGEGHLTRNMPAPLAALFGATDHAQANLQLDRAFYQQKLLPAFRRSCVKCHGSEKQRAGLRLDDYGLLVASGVAKWQDPYGSEIVKRLLLPRDDPAAMPPVGHSREVRNQDLASLIAWLQGHSLESLARQSGGLPEDLRQLADTLGPVDPGALARLSGIAGLRVMRLVAGSDLLIVNLSHVPAESLDAALSALQPYADHVIDLSWAGQTTSAAGWRLVAAMRNLRQLDLSRSDVSNADLAKLAKLQALHRLNLSGTKVALSHTELLSLLPGVRTLHLPAIADT